MSTYKLRPHHALCISFFEGRGYSPEFTENMQKIIEMLDSENPDIELVQETDIICFCCPHKSGRECTSPKVRAYDSRVLEICGFSEGRNIKWKDLSGTVAEKIIKNGRLPETCGGCQWSYICENKRLSV